MMDLKKRSGIILLACALLTVLVAAPVLATGEVPPPNLCVDVEKFCTDAAGPNEPIPYNITVTNCGDIDLWVFLRDITTGEFVFNGVSLAPGQTRFYDSSYFPESCGPSTNKVIVGAHSFTVDPLTGLKTFGDIWVYDTAFATCEVPCDGDKGCTLTPGYWKTHSWYGPAPYDEVWAMIGENTPFFLSGVSYYQALWTEPAGGNAYYILAHAYIAAELNILSGASIPVEVLDAWNEATVLFTNYTPAEIGALKGSDALRKQFVRLAGILDDYNNGLTGPGHCND